MPGEKPLHEPAAKHGVLVGDEPPRSASSSDRISQEPNGERTARPVPGCTDCQHAPREGVDHGADPEGADQATDPREVDHPDVIGTPGEEHAAGASVYELRLDWLPGTAPEDSLHAASGRLHTEASELTGDSARTPLRPFDLQAVDEVVGCTNGQVLWADAATGMSGAMVSNPAGNYGVSCAGHVLAFTDGWAIDQASGTLHQLFSNGTWIAVAFSTTVTPVEIVEKQVDPALAGGFDNYLVAAGTNGMGQTVVEGFDRGSMLMLGTTTWLAAPRTATGITTSRQSDIFVSTQAPGGGAGDVLHCALPITAFTPTPLVSYGTGAPTDVSCAGNFLTILETTNPGPGAIYHFYDVAVSANVLHIGDAWVDPGAIGATGLDTWVPLNETPSPDSVSLIHCDAAGTAISIDGEEIRIILTGAIPSSVLAWLYNQQTTALTNYNTETMIGCGGCAPDEVIGRGPLEGALINPGTGQNVEYATGEEVFTFPVLSVPGVGIDLDIWLTYRSRRDFNYRYGQSWNLNQDVRLETKPNCARDGYSCPDWA